MEQQAVTGQNGQGVVIPRETVEASTEKKRKARKTLAQLPVYRGLANMKYMVAWMMQKSPRKLSKYFDQMLQTVSEAKRSVGMADISRNWQDRTWYQECARILVQDLADDFTTLRRLGVIVDKDMDNKAKSVLKSITAQLVAWRDYTRSEGVKSDELNTNGQQNEQGAT